MRIPGAHTYRCAYLGVALQRVAQQVRELGVAEVDEGGRRTLALRRQLADAEVERGQRAVDALGLCR